MSEGVYYTIGVAVFLLVFVFLFSNISFFYTFSSSTGVLVFDFVIMSFATYRLVRLISYDKITKFIREWSRTEKWSLKRLLHEIMICPWCSSIWAAMFVLFLYLYSLITLILAFILAISGVSLLIYKLVNKI